MNPSEQAEQHFYTLDYLLNRVQWIEQYEFENTPIILTESIAWFGEFNP